MLQSSWDWNNLHFGLVVAYQCPRLDTTEDVEYMEAQCIYHTPHGTPAADMSPLAMAEPPLQVTALLHGCLRVTVGWGKASFVANMGAHNGLEVSRLLKSKHVSHGLILFVGDGTLIWKRYSGYKLTMSTKSRRA